VGAATVAVEETKKLPQTILTYPMTLASQAAHIVMRFQQNLAELVIKGDSTLEALFPPKDEQPEWATFDEDADDADHSSVAPAATPDASDEEPRFPGRFALYSGAETGRQTNETSRPSTTPGATIAAPGVVKELDYETLTLAQLRARLQSLSVDDLEALLAYEDATKARAPFQTLLANRITRATAK
jgi:hypothetical protein